MSGSGTAADSLDRIRALWEGDAGPAVNELWRSFRKQTADPAKIIALIVAAGEHDCWFEVEPETMAAMREIASPSEYKLLT